MGFFFRIYSIMKYNIYNIASFLIFNLSLLNPAQAWQGGQNLPPTEELEKIIFNPAAVIKTDNDLGILIYKAATAPDTPISWKIRKEQAAYLKIIIPAGIKKLAMSINSTSLAGSQSVMFKDYDEMACEDQIPETPNIKEVKQPEWEVLTGSRSVSHPRDEASAFFQSGSCVFFGFANIDNPNANVQLEDVQLTYTISDISKFESWVKGDLSLSITEPVNGKVTIDQKDCPTECTHTYPADTDVTLTATATTDGYIFNGWGDDCQDKVGNEITIKMDSDKTCSAIFRLPPITLKIDPPSNGIIINYNDEKKLNEIFFPDYFNNDKNILCSKNLFKNSEDVDRNCSAEFIENQKVILLTVPLPGYKLQNWGTEATDAYGNSNTSYIKLIPIQKNDNNLIEIPTATFTNLAE